MAPLLFLTGFMGSGKSTIGREVATRLGWEFVDLDEAVVTDAETDIPSIFEGEGEAGFRRRECTVLSRILERGSASTGLVIALGGGTLTDPESAELVEGRGTVVYLEVGESEAWIRTRGSDRPLGQDRGDFARRLIQRRPLYATAADLTVSTDHQSVEEIADEVVRQVREKGGATR